MNKPLALSILFLILHSSFFSVFAKPVTYLWDMTELVTIAGKPASQEYKKIVQQAEGAIKKDPVAVTDKTICISGDKHNYESLSPYWWPDPKNPKGPYIARDGEFNPEFKEYDLPRLGKLKDNLVTCSKAFFLTGDTRYYDFFCRQLDVWFINPDTRMTPNFEYSQFIPGRNNGRGNPQGMTDVYNFNDMLESIRLVNSVSGIGKKRMKAVKTWFHDFADWMQTSEYGKKVLSTDGQRLTYETTIYNIFIFTKQKSPCKAIFKAFPEKRIYAIIEEDGKMPLALKRTKAFSYSNANLQRFVDFATLAKADGKRFSKEDLDRVQQAFDYISQYANNQKEFPYSEIGDWDAQVKLLGQLKEKFKKLKE